MPNEFTTEDVVYLRHGDRELLARLYRPSGNGPFPAVVDLHGGAWNSGDLSGTQGLDQTLAKNGFVVASLNFRHAADGYPNTLIDINYAIRWLKTRAASLNARADAVGVMGTSSGGHQAMLTAMRPRDARYASQPLAGGADATVRCAILLWPVIDPLGRYQYAQGLKASGDAEFADRVLPSHDAYWKTEAAMEEGNPVRALERGEKAEMPPVLYLQSTKDKAHPRPHLDRFVAAYRKAGGSLDLELYESAPGGFARQGDTPDGAKAQARIIEFTHKQLR